MPVLSADVSQLRRTSAGLQSRGSRIAAIMGASLTDLLPQIQQIGVAQVADVTPVSKPGYRAVQDAASGFWIEQQSKPGGLQKSTKPGMAAVDGTTAVTDIIQDAASDTNLDGSGGGFHYAAALIKGRRAISAPSAGPFSMGKRALAGPGFGPSRFSRATKPDLYPLEAASRIQSAMASMAARYGQDVARTFLEGV